LSAFWEKTSENGLSYEGLTEMTERSSHATAIVLSGILAVFLASAQASETLSDLSEAEFLKRAETDLAAVKRHRSGLNAILAYMKTRPGLFPSEKSDAPYVPRADEREEVTRIWKAALDYILALDSVGRYHSESYGFGESEHQKMSFVVAHSAFLAQYAFALDFIERIERDPSLDVVVNEPVDDLGLPGGMYAKFKLRFLNVGRATEFAAQRVLLKALWFDARPPGEQEMREDANAILDAGQWKGPLMTLQNGLKIMQDAGFTAWFPVQAGVSEWMGDTRVYRENMFLITQEQIAELAPKLEPGDVLLERREWFLSNVGLPGFWPHAALYVGTPEQRRAYFQDDEITAWLVREGHEDFEGLLKSAYLETYAVSIAPQEEGHTPKLIEAMSEGVLFTTLEHSAAADSLAVLRPRLGKADKARAILRAFGYIGRPYDFDFNFLTDQAMVCTEVIYKAYEPRPDMAGLSLPLVNVMGRSVSPANEIARQFAEHGGTDSRQFDLILFLDGHESEKRAVPAGMDEFRRSVGRPKWHVLVQDLP
jgi:hypothetical protein